MLTPAGASVLLARGPGAAAAAGEQASWTDEASVITAVASTLVALAALWLALRSDRRSRQALKVQTYLQLRTRFLELYPQLGDLDSADAETLPARKAYWHHVWDEYYVANKLAPDEFRPLWDEFFRTAMLTGLAHPSIRNALDLLVLDRSAGFAAYAQDLVDEVRRAQDTSGTDPATPSPGTPP